MFVDDLVPCSLGMGVVHTHAWADWSRWYPGDLDQVKAGYRFVPLTVLSPRGGHPRRGRPDLENVMVG